MFVFSNKRIPKKMARTHARVRGKSRSTRPVKIDLSFVTYKKEEIEALIVKFSKEEDIKTSKIGLILRDTYGIPSVKAITGKSITQILSENNLASANPEDVMALISRIKNLKKHLESNSRDTHNKRGLILLESKLRRLIKYYQKTGRIVGNLSY